MAPMRWNIFDPECPTRQLLDRIADKWTVLVLCQLADTTQRFGELRRELHMSQKVLTDVLRSLERDGFVSREVFATVPLRVEYRLTRLGLSLSREAQQLRGFAASNMPAVLAARVKYDRRTPKVPARASKEGVPERQDKHSDAAVHPGISRAQIVKKPHATILQER